jgi:hypothetical protein
LGWVKPFEEAYQSANNWRFIEITEEMRNVFSLGFRVEGEHKGPLNLSSVYAMKNYCEIYLQRGIWGGFNGRGR